MLTYGGDEVSAIVLDVGQSTTKIGYSGEDLPKGVFSSNVGTLPTSDVDGDAIMTDRPRSPRSSVATSPSRAKSPSRSKGKKVVGDVDINCWRPNMEIKNPMKDGLISDWDALESLVDYAFYKNLRINPANHPLMMVEPATNTKEVREKMAEIAFEKYNVPAFYLGKSPVLSSFAAGRSTSLVVEMGAAGTTVTPVFEGYILRKGESIQSQLFGGDYMSERALAYLKHLKIDTTPQYLVSRKERVDPGQVPVWTRRDRPNTTKSFDHMQKMRLAHEFKETLCAVSDIRFDESPLNSRPGKAFEFPTGYNTSFKSDRYRLAEALFQPKNFPHASMGTTSFSPLPSLIQNSVNACDTDIKPALLTSILLTGGNSLWTGLPQRLEHELHTISPGIRSRIFTATTTADRKFGAWTGGSILSSMGTFHQLWVSKKEYEEQGKAIIEKRCL